MSSFQGICSKCSKNCSVSRNSQNLCKLCLLKKSDIKSSEEHHLKQSNNLCRNFKNGFCAFDKFCRFSHINAGGGYHSNLKKYNFPKFDADGVYSNKNNPTKPYQGFDTPKTIRGNLSEGEPPKEYQQMLLEMFIKGLPIDRHHIIHSILNNTGSYQFNNHGFCYNYEEMRNNGNSRIFIGSSSDMNLGSSDRLESFALFADEQIEQLLKLLYESFDVFAYCGVSFEAAEGSYRKKQE
jgi:hypothetical protein